MNFVCVDVCVRVCICVCLRVCVRIQDVNMVVSGFDISIRYALIHIFIHACVLTWTYTLTRTHKKNTLKVDLGTPREEELNVSNIGELQPRVARPRYHSSRGLQQGAEQEGWGGVEEGEMRGREGSTNGEHQQC